MSYDNQHDWLSLIEISGPFLAVPVLKESFPQGLEELDATKRKRLRQAYDEWREALELEDIQFAELHTAWIDEVLSRGLELDEDGIGDVLKRADWCSANFKATIPEHGVVLSPDFAVVDEQHDNKPLLLIQTYAPDVALDVTFKRDGWVTTPTERMVQLCRSMSCRLGLVTNGERWMLVDAPVGAVTSFASWYARIWGQESITLKAFVHLLGIRRFFLDGSEQLPALLDRSLKFQDEVTEALGEQVRRAVEVLIQTLDKADQDRNRELLHDVTEPELYEAALTVMMRLVFLLSAEERGLLLMGDDRYEANYALSTLRMQLRKESDEILERRWDAWSRLLAVFRAVFGGIEHENLRLPALGGSLFNPDRFPFLEGRAKGSNWRSEAAKPLPIDNRTVLLLLEAIQQYQGRTLSYRALDVEQIGYVYEGLLERTVKRTEEVMLELDATKSAKIPWVKLAELDSARLDGASQIAKLLQERSGSSASRVKNDLTKPIDDSLADRLLTACQGDTKLRDRIKPYAHLLRTDPWGYPLVYPAGAFVVTSGSDRRESGTHYTPKSLTEAIVTETLTPVAFIGPAEGLPREQWVLKSPAELLDLKICDPAMGSGAFLVQACRWLSERLVEAWSQVEIMGKTVNVDGEVQETVVATEPLPRENEARLLIARRLIAERCLYGVDLNPLAVELAKLSIWLVTLAKGRPFGFLDHNLRSGDSLFGVHKLEQLTNFSLHPEKNQTISIFASITIQAIKEAIALRIKLRETPIRDIRDVQYMKQLAQNARNKLEQIDHIADAMFGEIIASCGQQRALDAALVNLSTSAAAYITGDMEAGQEIIANARKLLSVDLPSGSLPRKPFHWVLEFPEVFESGGFDGVIGNPPFMGGRKMRSSLGDSYIKWLQTEWPHASLNSDFCAFFFLRAMVVLKAESNLGLLSTNTIAQGDTAKTGLSYLVNNYIASIRFANSSFIWPGKAIVMAALVIISKGKWNAPLVLNGSIVDYISPVLDDEAGWGEAVVFQQNKEINFQGSVLGGMGFVLTEKEAESYILNNSKNSEVIYPYLGGDDVNSHFEHKASRWAVDFRNYDLDFCERNWPELLNRIRGLVKPQRDLARRVAHKTYWWHHGDKRPALYGRIRGKDKVFVISRHTKYVAFVAVSTHHVFQESLCIVDLPSWSSFSMVQSSIHDLWVRRGSSTVGATLRYTPSDYFDTYPFLHIQTLELEEIGEKYHKTRNTLLIERNEGLTDIYNHLHDPENTDDDIVGLRVLHKAMDELVLQAYGWGDLDLAHGFYVTNQGTRFTISAEASSVVLKRLLNLNLKLHEDQTASFQDGKSIIQRQDKVQSQKTHQRKQK